MLLAGATTPTIAPVSKAAGRIILRMPEAVACFALIDRTRRDRESAPGRSESLHHLPKLRSASRRVRLPSPATELVPWKSLQRLTPTIRFRRTSSHRHHARKFGSRFRED